MGRRAKLHWYSAYRELKPALAQDGVEKRNALIREGAEAASYQPKVFARMVYAGLFLDELRQHLEPGRVACGYVHIEVLERIWQLNQDAAESLVDQVLNNELSIRELQEIRDGFLDRPDSREAHRSYSRKKVLAFNQLCAAALQTADLGMFCASDGELVKVNKSKLFKSFYMVKHESGKNSAIFTRRGEVVGHPYEAAADLLPLALHAKFFFDKVWFLFAKESELVPHFSHLARTIDLTSEWLAIATIDSKGNIEDSTLTSFGFALSFDVEGCDPFGWEGISVSTGGRIRGKLKPTKEPSSGSDSAG